MAVISSYGHRWDRDCAKVYYDDYFSGAANVQGDKVYVAAAENKIIGLSGYSIDRYEADNYWLGWFYVHEQYARNKVGSRLLNHIVGMVRKKKARRLYVNTSSYPFYRAALNFYLKNKFRIEAIIKNYYWNGEDQIILSRKI